MNERLHKMPRRMKLLLIAPFAIFGMALFIALGGGLVMLLWNWLAPLLFGLRELTFWQALGLLALCRILFGGFGLSGGHRNSRSRIDRRMCDRVRERVGERWEEMTPEQQERFRGGIHADWKRTRPLDSDPSV